MTTSRELVIKTLQFESPERIPRQLWMLPWADLYHHEALTKINEAFPADIITCPAFLDIPLPTQGDPYVLGRYKDEWGCVFENRQAGLIGEIKEPLLGDWKDVDKVKAPVEAFSVNIDQVNEFCRSTDKFVMGACCPRPFERLQFIRKSENLYLDLGLRPDELYSLIDRIHQFYKKELEIWASTEVDGLMFMDDWGSQNDLLISPAMWRELFRPLYKDYIDIAHKHGKKIFMHSDGNTRKMFPDLIELGLDAINSQIFCIGLENLKAFRGQITFWGEIDRQHLLPHGSLEDIQNAVKAVKDALYDHGGIIAQCEFGAGAKPENVRMAFEAWDEALD